MDVLSSIYTLDPFVNKEGFTAVIYEPTKFGFDDGQPYEFEFMVDDIFASWQRYTIYKHTISISWLHPFGGREFKLKKAPHEKGLPVLAQVTNARVLATMKRLGLFELAERILDAQSSAFPTLRS